MTCRARWPTKKLLRTTAKDHLQPVVLSSTRRLVFRHAFVEDCSEIFGGLRDGVHSGISDGDTQEGAYKSARNGGRYSAPFCSHDALQYMKNSHISHWQ